MESPREEQETLELNADHPDEILVYRANPDFDYGEFDWDGYLWSWGAEIPAESQTDLVQVLIRRDVPRAWAVRVFREIADEIERAEELETKITSLQLLKQWFTS